MLVTYENSQHLINASDVRIAHRGGGYDWPEHSARAYRWAFQNGYRAFEASLNVSGPEGGGEFDFGGGEIFLCHDWLLDRVAGTTNMAAQNTPWSVISELDQIVPETAVPEATPQPFLKFSDYLDEFGDQAVHFVDFKAMPHSDRMRAVQMIKDRGLMDRVVGKLVYGGPETYDAFEAEAAIWHHEGAPTWGAFYDNNVPDFPELVKIHHAVGLESASTFWPEMVQAAPNKLRIAHIIIGTGGLVRSYSNGATGVMCRSPKNIPAVPPPPPGEEAEEPNRGPWSQIFDDVYVGDELAAAMYIGPNLIWKPWTPEETL